MDNPWKRRAMEIWPWNRFGTLRCSRGPQRRQFWGYQGTGNLQDGITTVQNARAMVLAPPEHNRSGGGTQVYGWGTGEELAKANSWSKMQRSRLTKQGKQSIAYCGNTNIKGISFGPPLKKQTQNTKNSGLQFRIKDTKMAHGRHIAYEKAWLLWGGGRGLPRWCLWVTQSHFPPPSLTPICKVKHGFFPTPTPQNATGSRRQ